MYNNRTGITSKLTDRLFSVRGITGITPEQSIILMYNNQKGITFLLLDENSISRVNGLAGKGLNDSRLPIQRQFRVTNTEFWQRR